MVKNISFKESNTPRFELVLQIRDSLGNLTGKTKIFTTDDAVELEKFWLRNHGIPKKKRKENKEENKEEKKEK